MALIRGGFLATILEFKLTDVFCLIHSLLCTVWLSYQYLKIRRLHVNKYMISGFSCKIRKADSSGPMFLGNKQLPVTAGTPFGQGKYSVFGHRLTSSLLCTHHGGPVSATWCQASYTLPVSLIPIIWHWGLQLGPHPRDNSRGVIRMDSNIKSYGTVSYSHPMCYPWKHRLLHSS